MPNETTATLAPPEAAAGAMVPNVQAPRAAPIFAPLAAQGTIQFRRPRASIPLTAYISRLFTRAAELTNSAAVTNRSQLGVSSRGRELSRPLPDMSLWLCPVLRDEPGTAFATDLA